MKVYTSDSYLFQLTGSKGVFSLIHLSTGINLIQMAHQSTCPSVKNNRK